MQQSKPKRFLAFLIDAFVVALLLSACYAIFKFPDFPGVSRIMLGIDPTDQKAFISALALFNKAQFESLFIWFLYDVIFLVSFKATIGKLCLGLKLKTFDEVSFIKFALLVVLRSVLKILSMVLLRGVPFLLTVLAVFMNTDASTGYDQVAKLKFVNIKNK